MQIYLADAAFGKKRLQDLFGDPPLSAQDLITKIKSRLIDHIHRETQFDDITIMALRRMA